MDVHGARAELIVRIVVLEQFTRASSFVKKIILKLQILDLR